MLLAFILNAKSQDTLTVFQYNLLYYGINTDFCTSTNNNITQKEQNLKKILQYVNPHIISVNEMDASATIANRFLTNVLNTNGISYYKRADFSNSSGSNTMNMLYYDSRKLGLHSQVILTSYFRDINMYKLYHKSPDLPSTHDTTFIYCVVAHLKAGSTDADKQTRKLQTQYAMSNLNTSGVNSSVLIMGDFNTQASSEASFQNLITHSNQNIRFYDPVNQLGTWNNSSTFKKYHTQSTTINSDNCHAGGGMDDRFDFILINNAVKNGTYKVHYVDDSYRALGQDGYRFNSSVIFPTNADVPVDVANALYYASDHVPVVLKLLVDRLPASFDDNVPAGENDCTYALREGKIELYIHETINERVHVAVYNVAGQLLNSDIYYLNRGFNLLTTGINAEVKGIRIVRIMGAEGGVNAVLKIPVL